MFLNILSKKKNSDSKANVIYSPASGDVIPLNKVKDEVFASGTIGKGCGFILANGDIYAPVDGTVEMLFPTKHALGIRSDDGKEIMLHIGIDTVELNGKGFNCLVEKGDKVSKGQKIMEVDLDYIISMDKDPTLIVVVTNYGDNYKDIESIDINKLTYGQELITLI